MGGGGSFGALAAPPSTSEKLSSGKKDVYQRGRKFEANFRYTNLLFFGLCPPPPLGRGGGILPTKQWPGARALWGGSGVTRWRVSWSAAGGANWPTATDCPSLGPSPSVGGGAHRPLTTVCPSCPSLAYLSVSTSLSFPSGGCANAAPGPSPVLRGDRAAVLPTHIFPHLGVAGAALRSGWGLPPSLNPPPLRSTSDPRSPPPPPPLQNRP